MTGFEQNNSDVGSDCSAYCATNTNPLSRLVHLVSFLDPPFLLIILSVFILKHFSSRLDFFVSFSIKWTIPASFSLIFCPFQTNLEIFYDKLMWSLTSVGKHWDLIVSHTYLL